MTDLKPDNVMIVPEPHMPGGERTKLLDFGIAKVVEKSEQQRVHTKTDALMGTPVYMSPEQCEGAGRVDGKSDVYSLGVMIFEMLAGAPPFSADGPGKVLGMHMFMAPPLLKDRAPDVPAKLAELVSRLLVKDRAERPSMGELYQELSVLAEEHPLPRSQESARYIVVPPVDPLLATEIAPNKSTLGASAVQLGSATPRRWRRLVVLFSGGLLLVALAAAAVFVKLTSRGANAYARLRQAAYLVAHATDPEPAPQPVPQPVPDGAAFLNASPDAAAAPPAVPNSSQSVVADAASPSSEPALPATLPNKPKASASAPKFEAPPPKKTAKPVVSPKNHSKPLSVTRPKFVKKSAKRKPPSKPVRPLRHNMRRRVTH